MPHILQNLMPQKYRLQRHIAIKFSHCKAKFYASVLILNRAILGSELKHLFSVKCHYNENENYFKSDKLIHLVRKK